MKLEVSESFRLLEKYVRNENYSGYDPYDALNSAYLNKINSKFMRVFFTQLFVYSPINLRSFFHINKEINPKALGLLLSSYCTLYKIGLINGNLFENVSTKLVNLLIKYNSKGFSGYCWGFNFNWQNPDRNAKKFTPTLVVSSYIGNSFLDLYEITHKKEYFDIAESITRFIINDLNIRNFKDGICFSYSPIDNHVVHNANCLGAAFLSRIYNINKNNRLLDYSQKAVKFLISRQYKDGSWEFQLYPESGKVINLIDFHQGFIINAFCDFIKYSKLEDNKYIDSIKKAASFYKQNQFNINGRAKWRLPHNYPIDIHHQAQGIITFNKLYSFFEENEYFDFSKKIAEWTINNMQDEKGYFYHQKWPLFTNKIPYMRWGQAWMLLALATYLASSNIHLNQVSTNDQDINSYPQIKTSRRSK